MNNDLEIVYWAKNDVEADLMVNYLKENGIMSQKLQESFGHTNGLNFGIFGQVAIGVAKEHADEANALILDMDNTDLPDDISKNQGDENKPDQG